MAYSEPMHVRWKTEAILAGCLIAFGLVALPYAVYLVGQRIVGPYEGEGGFFSLMGSIWGALAQGHMAAWVLVLSPYLVVQLIRLGANLRRTRIPVKHVTD